MPLFKKSYTVKLCILLTLTVLSLLKICGQDLAAQVICGFAKDSIDVHLGHTFSNKFYIQNNTSESVHLMRDDVQKDLALISLPDTINLQPGEERSYYIKYLASTTFIRKVGQQLTVNYLNDGYKIQGRFFLNLPEITRLQLSSLSANAFLNEQEETATINLLCNNVGFKPLTFELKVRSYPQGMIVTDKSLTVTLPAGNQQTKTINLRNALGGKVTRDYAITVEAFSLEGERLASFNTKIIQLSSNKQVAFTGGGFQKLMTNNLALSFWNSGSNYKYYQLEAKGQVGLGSPDHVEYGLHVNRYTQPVNGWEMFDSYLKYVGEDVSIKLGSIGANLDFPMYGNGVEVVTRINEKQSLSALYVKNNYLLFSDLHDQWPGSDIWAIHYDFHQNTQHVGGANLIYSKDPMTGVQTKFINGDFHWLSNGNEYMNFEFGLSNESLPGSAEHMSRSGIGMGAHYGNQWGKWRLYSDNYYSSAYYSGLNRGSLLMDQRISYQINNQLSNFIAFTKKENKPMYLNNIYFRSGVENSATSYSYSITKRIGALSLSLRPYYFEQSLAQDFSVKPSEIKSEAFRGEMTAILQLGQQQLLIIADAGKVNSDNNYLNNKNYYSWKTSATFNGKYWGFQALIQKNPFYIQEEPNVWQKDMYNRYSFGPNFQLSAFNNRLQLYASDYANNLSYTGSWYNTFQLQAAWVPARTWKLEAAANLNTYFYHQKTHFLQTRISLEKQFIQTNAAGYHKITFQFFGDTNGNGSQDASENPIRGVIATLNQTSAISDKKGRIVFSNLSGQNYTLKVIDGKSWSLIQPIDVIITRNQRRNIALVNTVQVTGELQAKTNKYSKEAVNVEGIQVVAAGLYKVFSTLTDAEGKFSFYLPVGDYKVSPKLEGLPYTMDIKQKVITVRKKNMHPVVFVLKDQSRKVDIKEF